MVLPSKVERAFCQTIKNLAEVQAHLVNETGGFLQVIAGADMEEQAANCVVVECSDLKEEPQGTGNYWATVRVLVKSEADQEGLMVNQVNIHEARSLAVLGGLKRDDLHEWLTNWEPEFYVYDGIEDMGSDPSIQGRRWVNSNVWRIYCCASDLTP